MSCPIPQNIYSEMSSFGITDPNIISNAWKQNNELPFDKQSVNKQVVENALYKKLFDYFGNRKDALVHSMYSYTYGFSNTMAGKTRDEITVEDVVGYVESLRRAEIKKEENRRNAINNEEVYSITFGANTEGELQLDDVSGYELYSVLTPLFAQYGDDIQVTEILQAEYRKMFNSEDPLSDLQKAQKDRLERVLRNAEEVMNWYKKLHEQIDDNQIFDLLVQQEPTEVQKNSEKFDKATVSQHDMASAKLRAIIYSMPLIRRIATVEGTAIISEYVPQKSESFGLVMAGASKQNFNIISKLVEGVTNYPTIHKILTDNAQRFPQFEFLLKFIPDPNPENVNPKDISFINEFIQVFSLVETTPYIANTSTKEVGNELVSSSRLYSRMPNSTKDIMKELDSGLARNESRVATYLTDGKLDLKKLLSTKTSGYTNYGIFYNIDAMVGGDKLLGKSQNELEVQLNNKSIAESVAEFLFAIGFDEARYLVKPGSEERKKFIEYFSKPDNKNAVTILFRKLSINYKNGVTLIENPLKFLMEDSGKDLKNLKGREPGIVNVKVTELNRILEFFAELRPDKYVPTYLNAENELKYARSEYFVLTQTSNELNKANTMMDVYLNKNLKRFHILNNPDIEGSQWMARSFVWEKVSQINEKESSKVVTRYFFPSSRKELLALLLKENYITQEQHNKPNLKVLEDVLFGKVVDGKYTGKTENGRPAFLMQFKRVSKFKIIDFTGMEELRISMQGRREDLRQNTDGLLPAEKALQDMIAFFSEQTIENVRFGDKTRTLGVMRTRQSFEKNRNLKFYIPFARTKAELVFDRNSTEIDVPLSPEFLAENLNAPTVSKILNDHIGAEFQRIKNALTRVSLGIRNPSAEKSDTFGKNELRLFFGDFATEAHSKAEDEIEALVAKVTGAHLETPERQKEIQKDAYDNLFKIQQEYSAEVRANFNKYIGEEVDRLKELLEEGAGSMDNLLYILNQKNFVNINNELEKRVPKAQSISSNPIPLTEPATPQTLEGMEQAGAEEEAPKKQRIVDVPIDASNLDYILSFFLKNAYIHNMEFFKFSTGSLANFDKTDEHFREVFKRILNKSSPGKIPNTTKFMADVLGADRNSSAFSRMFGGRSSSQRWGELHTVVFKEVKTFTSDDWEAYKEAYGLSDEKHKPYVEGPKEADAQGVSTIEFYRNYLMSTGSWDYATQEETYKKEIAIAELLIKKRSGEKSAEEIEVINEEISRLKRSITTPLPPLKLGYYGSSLDRPDQTVYHKFSVKPMLPSEVSEFDDIYPMFAAMYKNGVDYYTFESGSKESNPKPVQPFYTVENGKKTINTDFAGGLSRLNLSFLRELQYQAPKFKKSSTLTSQGVKLLFSDLFDDGKAVGSKAFREFVNAQQNKFSESIGKIIEAAKVELDNQLGITRSDSGEFLSLDETKLAEFIVKKEKDNLSLRDYVKVNEDGKLQYNLDGFSSRTSLEMKLVGHILQNVVRIKIHGDNLIQTSQTPYVGSRPESVSEYLKENGAIGTDAGLKFYRIVNGVIEPMEIMVGWDEAKHAPLLELEYDGEKLRDKSRPVDFLNAILSSNSAKDKEWVKKHARHFTYTAVRIPTQGPNSMENMRVKKFLSGSSGSTIILPAQIVTKSGSDYDIDKLTVYMPKLNRKGEIIKSSMTAAEYKQAQNKIKELRYELGMLLNQSNYLKPLVNSERTSVALGEEFYLVRARLAEIKSRGKTTNVPKSMKRERSFMKVQEFVDYANELIDKLNDLEAFEYGAGNEVIEVMSDMLSHPEMYDALITPNDSPNMKEAAKNVNSRPIKASDVFSPVTSYRIFAENILAREALGIDAKINTMQKEFQKAGLKFQSDDPLLFQYWLPSHRNGFEIPLGKIDFVDNSGIRISSIFNEFVNGHVDVSKEDWIILLGMSDTITPLAHTMLLQGTPLTYVLAFLRNPKVVEAIKNTQQSLVFRRTGTRLKYQFLEFVDSARENPEIAKKYPNLVNSLAPKIDDFGREESPYQRLSRIVGGLSKVYGNQLTEMFSTPEKISSLFGDESNFIENLLGYMQLAVIERQQESIRELTSLVDWNTANYESFAETFLGDYKITELKRNFNHSAIDYLTGSFGNSTLAKFNILPIFNEIYTKLFPVVGNRVVIRKFLAAMSMLRVPNFRHREFLGKLSNNYIHVHQALFKQDNVRGNHANYFYNMRGGLFHKKSIYTIETAYKQFSQTYPALVQTNLIAQNIQFVTSEASDYIQALLPISIDKDPTEEKLRRDALIDLLEHPDEQVRRLFTDIVLGSYYQNIDKYGARNIHNIAPASLLTPQESVSRLNAHPKTKKSFDYYVRLVGLVSSIGSNPYTLFASYNTEPAGDQSIPKVLDGITYTEAYNVLTTSLLAEYPDNPENAEFNLGLIPFLGPQQADSSFAFVPAKYEFGISEVEEAPVPKPAAPSVVSGPTAPSQSTATPKTERTLTRNPKEYVNHSGGAYGGDTFWDLIGREFGVTQHRHYREEKNQSLSKRLRESGVKATVLSKEQMDAARAEIKTLLGIEYSNTLQGNLQVRNYYQVANADAVFAIGELVQVVDEDAPKNLTDPTKSVNSYKWVVKGGTNTAVQLGIKLGKPVYVWDTNKERWTKYNDRWFDPIDTPVLTKNFAGVGTRDIELYNVQNKQTQQWEPRKQYVGDAKSQKAMQAIRDVYEKTFFGPVEATPEPAETETPVAERVVDSRTQHAWELKALETQDQLTEQLKNAKGKNAKEKNYNREQILKARLRRDNNLHAVFYEKTTPYPIMDMIYDTQEMNAYEIAEKVLYGDVQNVGQLIMAYRDLESYIPNMNVEDQISDKNAVIAKYFVRASKETQGKVSHEDIKRYTGLDQKDIPGQNLWYGREGGVSFDRLVMTITELMGRDWYEEKDEMRPVVTPQDIADFILEHPKSPYQYLEQLPNKDKATKLLEDLKKTITKNFGGYEVSKNEMDTIISLGYPEIDPGDLTDFDCNNP